MMTLKAARAIEREVDRYRASLTATASWVAKEEGREQIQLRDVFAAVRVVNESAPVTKARS